MGFHKVGSEPKTATFLPNQMSNKDYENNEEITSQSRLSTDPKIPLLFKNGELSQTEFSPIEYGDVSMKELADFLMMDLNDRNAASGVKDD